MHVFNKNFTSPQNPERTDLVFENRFREYGAYQLRSKYNRNMLYAMGITFSVLLLGGILSKITAEPVSPKLKANPEPVDTTICYIPWQPERETPVNQNPGSSKSGGEPEFDPDLKLLNDLILPEMGVGTDDTGSFSGPIGKNGGEANAENEPGNETRIFKPESYNYILPKYRGGQQQFEQDIREAFGPAPDCDAGIQPYAVFKFVVNLNGSLNSVTIEEVSSSCPEFGDRIRAILENNKGWIPASKNGKFVRSWMKVTVKLRFD